MATVFVIVAVLARRLSIEDFASYIATASLVTLLGVFGMLGLNQLVCRRIAGLIALNDAAGAATMAKKVAVLGLFTSLLTAAAFWIIAPWLSRAFACPALVQHAPVIATWIVLLSLSQIIAEAFRGIHNLFAAGILAGISGGLLANLQFLLSIFALDYVHRLDYRTTTWAAAASFLLPTLGGLMWLVWSWPRGASRALLPAKMAVAEPHQNGTMRSFDLLGHAIAIMLVNLIALGFDQAGQLIAKRHGVELDVIVFEAVWRLAMIGIVPLTMLGLAAASTMAEMQAIGNRNSLEKLVRGVSTVGSLLSLPVLVLLIVFARPVLTIVFGTQFAVGGNALIVLSLVQIIRNWAGPCDTLLIMTGHQRAAFWCFALASPILLAGPWAVRAMGVTGIAIVIALAVLASRLLQYATVRRVLALKPQADLSAEFCRKIWRFFSWRTSIPTTSRL